MASVPADGFPSSDPRMHEMRRTLRANRDRATLLAQYRATCVRPDVETDAWFESRIDHIFGVSDGHFDGGAESMRTLSVGAKLGSITLPTLVIAGSADTLLPANLDDFRRLPTPRCRCSHARGLRRCHSRARRRRRRDRRVRAQRNRAARYLTGCSSGCSAGSRGWTPRFSACAASLIWWIRRT